MRSCISHPSLVRERADGRLYRRIIVAVPIHANDNVVSAQSGRWRRNRHPNVVDDSRSLDVCNDAFLTWFEGLQVISVTSGRICTGDSFVFLLPDFNFAKSNISFVMFDCAKTVGKYNPRTRESNKLNFVILLINFCFTLIN